MKRIIALLCILAVTACASKKETQEQAAPDVLFSKARSELARKNYSSAIKLYDELSAKYPYGVSAAQGHLDKAYAHYKSNENTEAIAACNNFIQLYPSHPAVDYAYYLKGLASTAQDDGILSRISRQDFTERDPESANRAFYAFKELITRFPNSKYAADARLRMQQIAHNLAAYELHVARYYLARRGYLAAANRAQFVVTNFPNTPLNEEALVIMVQAYDKLGQTQLRDDAKRVFELNYPHSELLSDYTPSEQKKWWKIW